MRLYAVWNIGLYDCSNSADYHHYVDNLFQCFAADTLEASCTYPSTYNKSEETYAPIAEGVLAEEAGACSEHGVEYVEHH